MNEYTHLAIVTSQHGEKFIGYVPAIEKFPAAYIAKCVEDNIPIVLNEVRLFVTQVSPEMSRETGQILGVKTFAALMPVDVFSGPMETLHVRPSSWYFASEVPSLKKKLDMLLDAAVKNEAVSQARDAGIHIPGRSS